MKHLFFSIRSLFLAVLLIGITHTAVGWTGGTIEDGILYEVYITGEKYNAVADSAYVGYNNQSNTVGPIANIASSVTYSYSWTELVGYDINNKPIYETITRNLTAPVIGIKDGYCEQTNNGSVWHTAFQGLLGVNIPNTIKHIGSYAFRMNKKLSSVNIPNSVTTIGVGAFAYCDSLSNVNIPNSVTKINDKTFYSDYSLTNIEIPNSVTYIGESAFLSCTSLLRINLPNSLTYIDNEAFQSCLGLNGELIIPNSVTYIGEGAFAGCRGLTGGLTIPNSITTISNRTFVGCSGLSSLNLSNSVTSIGKYAFSECSGLTDLSIPNSVITIDNYAFYNCTGLINASIGESVTTIGDWAFYKCPKLSNISSLAKTPPPAQSNSFSNYSATLHVPVGSIEVYQTTDPWSNFTNIVGINEPGDVNGDGGINISDVTALIDLLLSGGETSAGADVNGDGHVDISDVTALIDRLLSGN